MRKRIKKNLIKYDHNIQNSIKKTQFFKLIKKYNIKHYEYLSDMTYDDSLNELIIIKENYEKIKNNDIKDVRKFIEFNYAKSLQYIYSITFDIDDYIKNNICTNCINKILDIRKSIINNINKLNNKKINYRIKLYYIKSLNKKLLDYSNNHLNCICNFNFDYLSNQLQNLLIY
jgi:hypothetical protein